MIMRLVNVEWTLGNVVYRVAGDRREYGNLRDVKAAHPELGEYVDANEAELEARRKFLRFGRAKGRA